MYAIIINEETKQVSVGTGTNTAFYQSIGMSEMDVEQAYNGAWYLKGYVPAKPQSEINLERIAELKGLLSSTDYKAIKFAEGSLTEEEYAETRTERQSWRDEINQLEAESNE